MQCLEVLANLAAVAGAVVSVAVYVHAVNREKRILTIDNFSKIREKYPQNIAECNDEKKLEYLRDMEFFCLGINQKIYSFDILRKMSGKRLRKQYETCMQRFIAERRVLFSEMAWGEYEKVMECLSNYYACSSKEMSK